MRNYVITTDTIFCNVVFYISKGHAINNRFPKGTIFVRSISDKDAYMLVRNGVIIPNEGGVSGLMYSKQITEYSIPYKPSPII